VILFLCVDIGKERDRTAKYSCRSVKEAPPQLNFCGVGAGHALIRGVIFMPPLLGGAGWCMTIQVILRKLSDINFNPCTPPKRNVTVSIKWYKPYFFNWMSRSKEYASI